MTNPVEPKPTPKCQYCNRRAVVSLVTREGEVVTSRIPVCENHNRTAYGFNLNFPTNWWG